MTIPSPLHQDFYRIAILVYRSPQEVLITTNFDKHFIKMPDIAHSALTFLPSSGALRPKSVAPLTNRFIKIFESPLSQEIFDIPKTETESMVQGTAKQHD